jgi:hypothetical protein
LKCFPGQPRTELSLYNASATLASVDMGFDIRISNSTAMHLSLPGATTMMDQSGVNQRSKHRECDRRTAPIIGSSPLPRILGQRRDAYLTAICD